MIAEAKERLGKLAAEMIKDGMIIGLGSGSTTAEFIKGLGERIKEEGITVYGVPTSYQAHLLGELNSIRIVSSDRIDLAVDGADQIDARNFISKGGGGALLKEKLVDYRAERLIILADRNKFVDILSLVCVEIHPQAIHTVLETLETYGTARLRTIKGKSIENGDQVFITESGNVIIDVNMKVKDPVETEKALNSIPGIIENGLFTRECVILGRGSGIPG
jgi:ribose 5-phosphate isomerase A